MKLNKKPIEIHSVDFSENESSTGVFFDVIFKERIKTYLSSQSKVNLYRSLIFVEKIHSYDEQGNIKSTRLGTKALCANTGIMIDSSLNLLYGSFSEMLAERCRVMYESYQRTKDLPKQTISFCSCPDKSEKEKYRK